MSARAPAAILLLLLLLLSGCSMTGERLQNHVAKTLEKTDRYYAELEAEVFSEEGTQLYRVRQWIQKPGRWRVEVDSETASQVFIYDGEQIFVYQPGIDDFYRIDADMAGDVAPPFSLIGQLELLSKTQTYTFEGSQEQAGKNCYVVSFSGSTQAESTRLWLDTRTLFPMVAENRLDEELLSRIICTHLDVKPAIPEDLFLFEGLNEKEVALHCLITPVTLEEAKDNWPDEVYTPQYVPGDSFLFVISQGEEDGVEHLAFIYKGEYPFTLVQRMKADISPYQARGTEEVMIGENRGYYHPNTSGELATLWWSNGKSNFILSGSLPLVEMIRVAESLQVN